MLVDGGAANGGRDAALDFDLCPVDVSGDETLTRRAASLDREWFEHGRSHYAQHPLYPRESVEPVTPPAFPEERGTKRKASHGTS